MNEEIQLFLDDAKEHMQKALTHLSAELVKIRAGKAMPNMLDGLMVSYYGSMTPMQQVASINTPDARTLAIKPWEKNMISEIEKAIINSDLGLNPQNNGEMVMINIPPLTEERRKNLVKQVKMEGEQAKVSIRNIRKDANESVRKLTKEGVSEDEVKKAEEVIQKLTDSSVASVDKLVATKEEEIMTV